VALLAPTAVWFGLTFALLGAYIAGDAVSAWNIILEFCAPQDRPTYIGLTNTLLAPMVILAPVIGGWLAGAFGYGVLLPTALLCALAGALLLALWVREPRTPLPAAPAVVPAYTD
jgi:MFS family permease